MSEMANGPTKNLRGVHTYTEQLPLIFVYLDYLSRISFKMVYFYKIRTTTRGSFSAFTNMLRILKHIFVFGKQNLFLKN